MRLLKFVLALALAALAVTAGLFAAAIGVVAIAGFFLVRWLSRHLGGGASRPRVTSSAPGRPPAPREGGDVIDVTATEVRSDPALR